MSDAAAMGTGGTRMGLKAFFSTIMELSHGIVASLDEDGRIIQCNERLGRLAGATPDEVAGRLWADTCFGGEERFAAEAALRARRADAGITRVEGRMLRPDGRAVFIEWNLKPLADTEGDFAVTICVGQDVTSHMALETDLLRERHALIERNRELTCLYAISQAVGDMDRDLEDILGDVAVLIPTAFQFPEHVCAQIQLDGISRESGPLYESRHRLCVPIAVKDQQRGRLTVTYDGAFTASKPDAGFTPTDMFLDEERSLLDAVATQLGLVAAKKEALSAWEALERQLRHADRLAKIGQFAAGLAHELNEPLANILGFAQLAGKAPGLPEQVGRDLDNIVTSSLHAREIIRKLMFFCRQVPSKMGAVNLNDVVRDALCITESSANRNGVEVRTLLARDLPDVLADHNHMKQVVVNLAANAIQAMPGGGLLTIETRTWKDDVYLLVSDTGTGMGPEELKQIFTPFFTTKDVNKGTGLGLSVVHGIVKSHGGVIEAHSAEGEGSRFEIALPCMRSARSAE